MPQTQLFTRKAQVAVKAETTVDTLLAPVAGDVLLAGNVSYEINSENFSQPWTRDGWQQFDESSGTASATIKFRVPLKGSGVDATAPEWGDALKACGFVEVIGATSTYKTSSTFTGAGGNPAQSYTVAVFENGVRYPISGALGNVVFSGNCGAGEPGWMDFTFQGAYNAPTDLVMLAPTYDTTIAPAFRGGALAFAGGTPKGVSSFTLDMGNQIVLGQDVNAATGIYGARITSRKPTGSVNPEMQLLSVIDHFALWRLGTAAVFTTGPIGPTAENKWQLDIARCIRRAPVREDRGGISALTIPFAVGGLYVDAEGVDIILTLT